MPTPEDPERAALRARIERDYSVQEDEWRVDDWTLPVLRLCDPDAVLQQFGDEAKSGEAPNWEPYWAEAWGSSKLVGRVLPRRMLGTAVLDLGCGMGFSGCVAAREGASVTFADSAAPALLFARWNSWPWRRACRYRRLDWSRDRAVGEFDLVLCADVLYDTSQWAPLGRFWRQSLRPEGSVLLGEPGRRSGDPFPAWAEARGWIVETVLSVDDGGRVWELRQRHATRSEATP